MSFETVSNPTLSPSKLTTLLIWGGHHSMSNNQLESSLNSLLPSLHKNIKLFSYSLKGWRICQCPTPQSAKYILDKKVLTIKKKDLYFQPYLPEDALLQYFESTDGCWVRINVDKKWISKNRIKDFLENLWIPYEQIYILFEKVSNHQEVVKGPRHKNFAVRLKSKQEADILLFQRFWPSKAGDCTMLELLPFDPTYFCKDPPAYLDSEEELSKGNRLASALGRSTEEELGLKPEHFYKKPTLKSYFQGQRASLLLENSSLNNLTFRVPSHPAHSNYQH